MCGNSKLAPRLLYRQQCQIGFLCFAFEMRIIKRARDFYTFIMLYSVGLVFAHSSSDGPLQQGSMQVSFVRLKQIISVPPGKIYVVGGWASNADSVPLNTMEIYDITSDTWTAGPPTLFYHGDTCAVAANNKVRNQRFCEGCSSKGLCSYSWKEYENLTRGVLEHDQPYSRASFVSSGCWDRCYFYFLAQRKIA